MYFWPPGYFEQTLISRSVLKLCSHFISQIAALTLVYCLCCSISFNWGIMSVELASPELHKRLRFLNSSSIKRKEAGNTWQSLSEPLAPYYHTAAAVSYSDVHNPRHPLHDDLWTTNTSRHISYTTLHRVLQSFKSNQAAAQLRDQVQGAQVGRVKKEEEVFDGNLASNDQEVSVEREHSVWGSLKGWEEISELDRCPTPSFSPHMEEQAWH